MQELAIKIFESSNGDGYYYDIFDIVDPSMGDESIDGGFCTTTMENALGMATQQALEIIKRNKCV